MTDNVTQVVQPISATHALYSFMRFLRIVQRQKMVVVVALIITSVIGMLYYATAERQYEAKGQLLVLSNQVEVWDASANQGASGSGLLPTLEELFSSQKVIDKAIESLEGMPQEARIDLLTHPRDEWREELRDRLNANAKRATNIIEISYRSKKPRTAETVVNAVVDSYVDFIEDAQKNVAGDLAELLQGEIAEHEQRLKEITDKLGRMKLAVRDLGIDDKSAVVHPAIQRVTDIHTKLIGIQQSRMSLQASLAALRNAIASGGNVQQHILALEPTIGKEVVLGALGLSTKDGEVVTHLERMLFEEQATLDQLSGNLPSDRQRDERGP